MPVHLESPRTLTYVGTASVTMGTCTNKQNRRPVGVQEDIRLDHSFLVSLIMQHLHLVISDERHWLDAVTLR